MFGFLGMIYATLSIAVIGSCVWAHHMYTIGASSENRLYFSCATMIIAVPTSIKIFSWLFTIIFGDICVSILYYFIIGFLIMFLLGGFTGLMLANSTLDILLHDSYYVVAHFHYVLSLGAVFGAFLYFFLQYDFYYGIVYHEFIGITVFGSIFFGTNLLFFPQHFLGLIGFPRRIFCYPDVYGKLNEVSNVGILLITLALICLIEFSIGMLNRIFVIMDFHFWTFTMTVILEVLYLPIAKYSYWNLIISDSSLLTILPCTVH